MVQPSLFSFLIPLCISIIGLGGFAALVRHRVLRPAGMTKVSTSEEGSDDEHDGQEERGGDGAGLGDERPSEAEEDDEERAADLVLDRPVRGSSCQSYVYAGSLRSDPLAYALDD